MQSKFYAVGEMREDLKTIIQSGTLSDLPRKLWGPNAIRVQNPTTVKVYYRYWAWYPHRHSKVAGIAALVGLLAGLVMLLG